MQEATTSLPGQYPEPDGILLVDKPAGMTSHDVVFRIRKLFSTRKVGHTGTLDPMATGVLVVLLGRAAKASEYVSHDEKKYVATLRLGLTTDTEDTGGTILSVAPSGKLPTTAQLEAVLPSFRGDILQIPPMYSALKVSGQKLCDLARRGEVIERQARPVRIFALSATPGHLPSDYTLNVHCGGGTYIRTLCADIGAALGCGGAMATLRRTMAGGFQVTDCYRPEALEAMSPAERLACLRPTEELFSALPRLPLSPFFFTLCRNGCTISQEKLKVSFPAGTRVRLYNPDKQFFALGEAVDTAEGHGIKMMKLFIL